MRPVHSGEKMHCTVNIPDAGKKANEPDTSTLSAIANKSRSLHNRPFLQKNKPDESPPLRNHPPSTHSEEALEVARDLEQFLGDHPPEELQTSPPKQCSPTEIRQSSASGLKCAEELEKFSLLERRRSVSPQKSIKKIAATQSLRKSMDDLNISFTVTPPTSPNVPKSRINLEEIISTREPRQSPTRRGRPSRAGYRIRQSVQDLKKFTGHIKKPANSDLEAPLSIQRGDIEAELSAPDGGRQDAPANKTKKTRASLNHPKKFF